MNYQDYVEFDSVSISDLEHRKAYGQLGSSIQQMEALLSILSGITISKLWILVHVLYDSFKISSILLFIICESETKVSICVYFWQ